MMVVVLSASLKEKIGKVIFFLKVYESIDKDPEKESFCQTLFVSGISPSSLSEFSLSEFLLSPLRQSPYRGFSPRPTHMTLNASRPLTTQKSQQFSGAGVQNVNHEEMHYTPKVQTLHELLSTASWEMCLGMNPPGVGSGWKGIIGLCQIC